MLRNGMKIYRNRSWSYDTNLNSTSSSRRWYSRWFHHHHNTTSSRFAKINADIINIGTSMRRSACNKSIARSIARSIANSKASVVPLATFLLGWTCIMFSCITSNVNYDKQHQSRKVNDKNDSNSNSNSNSNDDHNNNDSNESSSKDSTMDISICMATSSSKKDNTVIINKLNKHTKPNHVVDFIVIGNGNAGRSAIQTIKKKCPNASIMVIDPLSSHIPSNEFYNHNNDKDNTTSTKRSKKSNLIFKERFLNDHRRHQLLQYMLGSVINFDPTKQTVDIILQNNHRHHQQQDHSNNYTDDTNSNNQHINMIQRIKYKHSLLIATGSRGAMPLESAIDERAKERILEYRSTQQFTPLLFLHRRKMEQSDNNNNNNNHNNNKIFYPVLSRATVRQIGLMAASSQPNANICILGSGLEAMELAASIAEVQRRMKSSSSSSSVQKQQLNSNSENEPSVSLIFGNAAPLVNVLPRYLSTAVSKRLRSHGINVQERSLVRYISSTSNIGGGRGRQGLEVHLVKSFDDLDTKRCQADLVILAPSVSGQQGTAVLPSLKWFSDDTSSPKVTVKSWSQMGSSNSNSSSSSDINDTPQIVSCYSDDGRIAVNSQLLAASNVYAAGSVAKYPNHITGHAAVAGEGIVSGSLAGRIAAENMIKEYYTRMNYLENNDHHIENDDFINHNFQIYTDLPILRTDKISSSGEDTSSLSSLGINALCVGHCDSENMSTHGFWWTNQSVQNKRLSRRMTKSGKSSKPQKAVYGSGVVFYLDRSASIRGVMIWGMPFTGESEGQNDLNKELLHRIKSIILSNGKILKEDHKSIIEKMNFDPSLLSQSHLAEESKYLAKIAIDGVSNKQDFSNISTSRMLHRYIPSKPMHVTSMGILKRNKAIGNGSVGDDVYERSRQEEDLNSDESARHPSLVHYFSYDWTFSNPIPIDNDDLSTSDHGENLEILSRPPKEDPLWFRRNESGRTMSMNEKMSDIFTQNIKRGHFFDGNDAVKQAPTPEFVANAREELERWVKSDDDRDN